MNKNKQLWAVIAVTLVLAGLFTGVLTAKREAAFNKKIIVLGVDAMDPAITERLLAEGKLPNFARLKETGSYSRLTTTNPAESPVAWAGFATGKNPGQNGVFDFIERDPQTYDLKLVFSGRDGKNPEKILKAKAFWNYVSEKKISVTVLSCPDTFPPDRVHGKMLSGMGVPDILGTEGTFTFYTSEPVKADKDIGGRVVQIKKEQTIKANLIGPRKTENGGEIKNAKIPFKLILQGQGRVQVEYQDKKIELETGRWSGWNEAVFDLGFFRKSKGIFKFYLISTEPEVRLYVSPINFDPRSPFFPISFPGGYAGELAREVGLYHTQGMPMDTWAVNEERLSEDAFLQEAETVFKERQVILDLELGRMKGGVLFCYFENIDTIQHMFWRYTDPRSPSYQDDPKYKNEIEKWYVRMDRVLGDILGKLTSNDTLIVLSDHGFGSFRRAAHLNSWLKAKGYLSLWQDIPNASDQELFQAVDWDNTQAYALGFGGIYINQRGREARGIVAPGEETESLKKKIAAELKTWIDEPSGEAVVRNVYRREDIFHGPYAKNAPDLYVGFNPGYRVSWQSAIGGVREKLVEDNLKQWSGDHLFDYTTMPGVIFSNRKILRKDPSIYDITPTLLKETGFTDREIQQEGFEGNPLF
jgi:predicted AlkP superfamily phosphohydrolase/phosphomutase